MELREPSKPFLTRERIESLSFFLRLPVSPAFYSASTWFLGVPLGDLGVPLGYLYHIYG